MSTLDSILGFIFKVLVQLFTTESGQWSFGYWTFIGVIAFIVYKVEYDSGFVVTIIVLIVVLQFLLFTTNMVTIFNGQTYPTAFLTYMTPLPGIVSSILIKRNHKNHHRGGD